MVHRAVTQRKAAPRKTQPAPLRCAAVIFGCEQDFLVDPPVSLKCAEHSHSIVNAALHHYPRLEDERRSGFHEHLALQQVPGLSAAHQVWLAAIDPVMRSWSSRGWAKTALQSIQSENCAWEFAW